MIVNCPTCHVRMKLDASRHDGKRVTIRCRRCRHVFKTNIATSPASETGRVLIVHSDEELCATIADIFRRENIPYDICHDGQAALRTMAAKPPAVALIDVALPGFYAFEVVEKVRRQPALHDVRIILLSSVYNKAAYKRSPTSLFGADDYLEKHHISDQLVSKVRRLGGGGGISKSREANAGVETKQKEAGPENAEKINTRVQQAEDHEVSSSSADSGWEKARRLARIIVSDIALYNEERVAEGIRTGTFYHILGAEVEEGRRLFAERVAEDIRSKQDLLQEAFDAFIERRQNELQS